MESRVTRALAIGALLVAAAACRLEVRQPESGRAGSASVLAAAADSAAVMAELEAYYADLSARDWVAFADHFWPDADLTTIWQPPGEHAARVVATSVPEFVARAPEGPGSRAIFEERMLEAQLVISGALAQAWVRFRARFGDPGAVREWEGTDAITLVRHQGRWRIASLVFVSDGPGS